MEKAAISAWQRGRNKGIFGSNTTSVHHAQDKEAGTMSMFISVRRLVERLAPEPVCDVCVADRLSLQLTDDLRATLGELAVERGFDRERDRCSLCGEERPVIRRRGRAA